MTADHTPQPSYDWQWDDNQWGDSARAPTSAEQVPLPDDDRWAAWPTYLRRLMRWAAHQT